MKVLIIPSWYVTEDKPNNGIFFKEQAQALQDAGLEVAVAYPDLRFRLSGLRRGIYRDYSSDVPTYIYRRRSMTPFWQRGRRPQIERMLEKLYLTVCSVLGEPDIVHLHSCRIGVETAALCKRHGLPLVYTEHYSGIMNDNADKDLKYSFQHTLKECSYPIAVSTELKSKMVSVRPDTLVIPNLVDTDAFKILPDVSPAGRFVFAAMGNLVPVKGFDVLIRAFARAKKLLSESNLIIAGEGPEKENLEALIRELGLSDSVKLVGFVTRKMAPGFYNSCDCFVCSSYSETFGIAPVEALACGKPVIATRCGGPEDTVRNMKNGLLVRIGDSLELSKAMVFMKLNIGLFNPYSIRDDCRKRFGKDYICQRIVQVYGYLMQQNKVVQGG